MTCHMVLLVEILLLGCLHKYICLLKAPFILRGCWYLFLLHCSETQWIERVQTSVVCLAGAYSVGWNIILKTRLPRLKDVHSSYLNHDLRMKRNIVQRCLRIWCFEIRFNQQFTDGVHGGGVLSLDASIPGCSMLEHFA